MPASSTSSCGLLTTADVVRNVSDRPTAGVRGPEIIAEKRPFAHSHVSHAKGLRTEGAPMQRLFSRYNRLEDCVLRIVRARCAALAAIATVIIFSVARVYAADVVNSIERRSISEIVATESEQPQVLHGARGRRWIDCYCDAGEATQRRAAFYPLQRHGKSARATLY